MNSVHHLRYERTPSGSVMPSGKVLDEQLSALPPLRPGDKLVMQDGQIFARVVAKLSDFDKTNTEAFCKTIMQDTEQLVLMRKVRGCLRLVRFIFAERRVIIPKGMLSSQVLVSAFGDPAWVNIDNTFQAFSRECYEKDKALYHDGYELSAV